MLASLDDGQLELLRVPTELQALSKEVVEELGGLASTTGVRISASGDSVTVPADPERLKQVLTNLVENAVKYAGVGAQVRVSIWQHEHEAGFTVSDTGLGIPAEAVPHLFDRFFRVDATRSPARQGSGLGLAICRDIVRAHGGRIWVESHEGDGSSFTVALPKT
jgi:signal transduction histidine kinase